MHDNLRAGSLLYRAIAANMIQVAMGVDNILELKILFLQKGQDTIFITAWINLTSAYTMVEEDDKAVDAARQAVTLEPDSAMARNNLAVALYFKGNYPEAQRNMEKAGELGYSVDSRFADALKAKLADA